ncbi:MAG: Arc family DNA-binding protein [Ramlibacter sp.]
MPNLSIKDVPEAWAEALRQRAARNHRSLQGELMAIIEQAAQEAVPARNGTPDTLPTVRPGVRRGWKSIEQIYAEHLVKYPAPIQGGPLAVDIIREDRDSR